MDINFLMASSSSFSVLCIYHTKVSVSEASCCGPPNSSLPSSSYTVHWFRKWTLSSTSSRSHILHFLSQLGTTGLAYLPVSIARLCAVVIVIAIVKHSKSVQSVDSTMKHSEPEQSVLPLFFRDRDLNDNYPFKDRQAHLELCVKPLSTNGQRPTFTLGVPNSDPHKLQQNHLFDVPPKMAIDTVNPTLSSYLQIFCSI